MWTLRGWDPCQACGWFESGRVFPMSSLFCLVVCSYTAPWCLHTRCWGWEMSSSSIRAKRSLSNPSITTSYASERRASVWRNLDCNRLSFNPTLILFGDERMIYELKDWDDHNERRRRAALICDPQSCVAFDKQMNFSDSWIAFTWRREIHNRSKLSFLADRWHYQH